MRPNGRICIEMLMGATKACLNLQFCEHAVEQLSAKRASPSWRAASA